jgi:cytidine deaminase
MTDFLAIGQRKISKDCTIKRHKLVAMAFSKSGHLICTETNRKGRGALSDFSIHAEEFLVRKLRRLSARERFGKIRVVVARLSRTGWAMARPCAGCQKMLTDYGITDIWYTQRIGIGNTEALMQKV